MKLVLALVAAATLAGSAFAVDIYKWKDAKGVVHYGDRPASGIDLKVIKVPDDEPSPEDEDAAQDRLDEVRAKITEPSDDDPPVVATPHRKHASARDTSCAAQWKTYDASQVCFENNRAAGGRGVSPAGVAWCKVVAQPSCSR